MLGKKSVRVQSLLVLALLINFVVGPEVVVGAAQNSGAQATKQQRRRSRSRVKKSAVATPTPASQTSETAADPTAVPRATQVGNQMNEQGEVGAQAKDNARETTPKGKRRARNRKFVPTPPPPVKPGQPSQQAGELAPTPAPAQPVKP
ncbi:MAG TPA: hypothetical protein VM870_04100 [Pyrinomonadaceae bacterium]|nr:hypothetical protein [Pyrinomonadaceae bacterium]